MPLAPPSRSPSPEAAPAAAAPAEHVIDFSADQVSYDDASADLVVAEGHVRMDRDGNYLASDRVDWNRDTGSVVAIGNVVVLSPEGDR